MAFLAMDCSSLGGVQQFYGIGARIRARVHGDYFRARIRAVGAQGVTGPVRCDKKHAEEDLASIRAVATGQTREENLAAMHAEAQRLKDARKRETRQQHERERRLHESGFIEAQKQGRGITFLARLVWTVGGVPQRLDGPCRGDKRRAEEDLSKLRAAAKTKTSDEEIRMAVDALHRSTRCGRTS